jgi:hypothetical protein
MTDSKFTTFMMLSLMHICSPVRLRFGIELFYKIFEVIFAKLLVSVLLLKIEGQPGER